MRRRELMFLLGGTAISWPRALRAQQKAMPVIGYLSPGSAVPAAPFMAAFRQGLCETGGQAQALLVMPTPFYNLPEVRQKLGTFAVQYGLPSMCEEIGSASGRSTQPTAMIRFP